MPRPRVAYVSYDGAEEPLGRSQVLPYLVRLAESYEITLISFEKSAHPSPALRAEIETAGIVWIPLRYHRRPPVLSTVLDVLAGRRALIRLAGSGRPRIVHVRSYVPALIALAARRAMGGKLLFDIRGFWADERVEGGLWRRGGVLYRVAKRFERRFFTDADAIVTLTEASVPQVRRWAGTRPVPIEVIPTCVDLNRFGERPPRPAGPHAVWAGSVGTWYRFDLVARAATVLSLPLVVMTRQEELARRILDGYPATVSAIAPDEVPGHLFARDVGLCLVKSSFSKVASAPTRFGEYLAAGMPVLATRGVGDMEQVIAERGVGVVLEGEDERAMVRAAHQLRELMADDALSSRCRRTARELYDVDAGAARYGELYRRLTSERD